MTRTAPPARTSALFTDLYELTMAQAYRAGGITGEAVFSLFVRTLPETRNYLLAAGLEPLLEKLEAWRFEPEDLAYLESLDRFERPFLDFLAGLRFSGHVRAVPEGMPVFAGEPILEITAPVIEGQLVETLVMNEIELGTVLASKAARVVCAAEGRMVVDFGGRRAHGEDAAVTGARAFHIAGVAATSNVLAGQLYGLPLAGTMAHSFIETYDREADAFRDFAALYPGTILLVDTYDTLDGVRTVIRLRKELREAFSISGIRLDSGDLVALSKEARALLDAADMGNVRIFASGGLDETKIAAILGAGAPIDAFGVGTNMGVSEDAPALDLAYKLTAYGGEGRLKLSTGKRTLPGAKQVFRTETEGGAAGDVIARVDETLPGRPLLETVMAGGRRTRPAPALGALQEGSAAALAKLPDAVKALEPAKDSYAVGVSAALTAYEAEIRTRIEARAKS